MQSYTTTLCRASAGVSTAAVVNARIICKHHFLMEQVVTRLGMAHTVCTQSTCMQFLPVFGLRSQPKRVSKLSTRSTSDHQVITIPCPVHSVSTYAILLQLGQRNLRIHLLPLPAMTCTAFKTAADNCRAMESLKCCERGATPKLISRSPCVISGRESSLGSLPCRLRGLHLLGILQ